MKKVRLKPKRGCRWSFKLYDSAESAYFMKDDDRDRSEYHQRVGLPPGTFMEIEWLGAEFIYDEEAETPDGWHTCFDKVRLARVTKKKTGNKDGIVLATGWVLGGSIPWSQATHDELRIFRINGEEKQELDFSELFKDLWRDSEEDTCVDSSSRPIN